MVHKSEVANTKKAENPLAQSNLKHSIFSSTGSHRSRIPFHHVILVDKRFLST